MAETTAYDDKTNDELRDELKSRDLAISGNKDELIQRLVDDDEAKDAETDDPDAVATGTNTAPTDDGVAANHEQTTINASEEQLGDTGPSRGGVQAIEFDRAQAEKEEREQQVKYTEATYKDPEASHLLREIAEELGLTRPVDYVELSRLNGVDLNARIDADQEVRLPQQYSYVDVEHVTGGAVAE